MTRMNYKRKNLELVRNKCERNFTWTGFTNQRLGVFGKLAKRMRNLFLMVTAAICFEPNIKLEHCVKDGIDIFVSRHISFGRAYKNFLKIFW